MNNSTPRSENRSSMPVATVASRPTKWRWISGRVGDVRLIAVGLLATLTVATASAVAAGNLQGAATSAAGSLGVPQPPADVRMVVYQPCDVTPLDYDELMTMIATVYREPAASPPVPASGITARSIPGGHYALPDGPNPSSEIVETLVDLLGTFETCSPLQRAALRPDDLLARSVFTEDGSRIVAGWWQDAHQVSEPPAVRDSRIGTPTIYQLYGFRTIDATHIAAYVELSGDVRLGSNPAAGTYQPTWNRDGYIVFTQRPDGRWLIDGFVSPLGDVVEMGRSDGSATPAA